jgi:integrase
VHELFKKKTTHWTLKGKRVPANTPGAERHVAESAKWYCRLGGKDWPLARDKRIAQRMLADLIDRDERRRAGRLEPFEDTEGLPLVCGACGSQGTTEGGETCVCPADPHLSDYRRILSAKGRHPRYVQQVVSHCHQILEAIGADRIRDIDAGNVELYLAELQDGGSSISTTNHALTHQKSFTRWLTRTRPPRWPHDPLAGLTKMNAETDIRRERRDVSEDELRRLLAATRADVEDFRGLTGEDRYWLYAVALQSGLRAGELASLTAESFRLDEGTPVIQLQAQHSKRRRRDVQPIPRTLAEGIRDWLGTKGRGRPLWPRTWHLRAYTMIHKDLDRARAAWLAEAADQAERDRREADREFLRYEDDQGRTADFHALRHSYVTSLARSGVHPKTAQELARHQDIRLTMASYTHVRLHDLGKAVEELPAFVSPLFPAVEQEGVTRIANA